MRRFIPYVLPALLLLLVACEPEPRDIRYGEEECAHCMMRVSDEAFAAQLVTQHARQYVFDSVECLAGHVKRGDIPADDIHSLWVANFDAPGSNWIAAEDAAFLRSDDLQSPMGLALSAYPDSETAETYREDYGGTVHTWSEVRSIVYAEWLENGDGHSHDMDDHALD